MRLITRLRSALSSGGERAVAVRAAVMQAQSERGRIELEPVRSSSPEHPRYTARLEQVLEDSLIIDMPVCNGRPRPLVRSEPHRIILTCPEGCLVGSTRVLGRARILSAGGDILHGYRLEMPASLQPFERRQEPRLCCDDELREAEILVHTHRGSILGRISDISGGGVRMNCRNGHNHIQPGQQVFFRMNLKGVGAIEQLAHVVGMELDEETGNLIVRLRFDQRVQRIGEALRSRQASQRGLSVRTMRLPARELTREVV